MSPVPGYRVRAPPTGEGQRTHEPELKGAESTDTRSYGKLRLKNTRFAATACLNSLNFHPTSHKRVVMGILGSSCSSSESESEESSQCSSSAILSSSSSYGFNNKSLQRGAHSVHKTKLQIVQWASVSPTRSESSHPSQTYELCLCRSPDCPRTKESEEESEEEDQKGAEAPASIS
jgi:hypothetical protein